LGNQSGRFFRRLNAAMPQRSLRIILTIVAVGMLVVPDALGEVFESKYLRFRLPDGWHCKLEGSEFTCEPPVVRGQKLPMLIILAAKIQGEHDTLPDYMAHLRQFATVEVPRINNDIGKVAWVDATAFESEVPSFYTRYLTTVSDGIAILVTFSAHKDRYPQFQSLITPCIRSLEIKSDWKKR
jgi:hypothetical protein